MKTPGRFSTFRRLIPWMLVSMLFHGLVVVPWAAGILKAPTAVEPSQQHRALVTFRQPRPASPSQPEGARRGSAPARPSRRVPASPGRAAVTPGEGPRVSARRAPGLPPPSYPVRTALARKPAAKASPSSPSPRRAGEEPIFSVPALEEDGGADAPLDREAEPTFTPQVLIPRELVKGSMRTQMTVRFSIAPDGGSNVELISGTGDAAIDRLALETLGRWRWRPGVRSGKPVTSRQEMSVEFVISEPR